MSALFESKPFAVFATIVSLFVILLGYIALQDVIERSGTVLFWIAIGVVLILSGMFLVAQFERLYTLKIQMRLARSKAQAEALKSQVITAQRGEQVFVKLDPSDQYHALHLNPQWRPNGKHEAPTLAEVQTYLAYQAGGQAAGGSELVIDQSHQIEAGDVSSLDILSRYTPDWIQTLLDAPHVHYCGATRSGKTTLANHHISHLAKDTDAKFYLINPKDTAARKPFIIEPNYRDIVDVLDGLQAFNSLMLNRKNDPNLTGNEPKMVFVIDEWDWIYETYGQQATRLLIPLVKVGAELKIQVILIGQSPLSGDTGLSQSFYNNMVRVAIWQEGARLLNNAPVDKRVKAPLKAEYETLKSLAAQYEVQSNNKLRYCATIPMAGNPTVQVIPFLSDPVRVERKTTTEKRPRPGSYDERVCRAWYETLQSQAPSGNKMHQLLAGKQARINSRQKRNYLEILAKYGIEPAFLEVS